MLTSCELQSTNQPSNQLTDRQSDKQCHVLATIERKVGTIEREKEKKEIKIGQMKKGEKKKEAKKERGEEKGEREMKVEGSTLEEEPQRLGGISLKRIKPSDIFWPPRPPFQVLS